MTPYYADDLATIYHSDARDVLGDLSPVDLILTDPPYSLLAARDEWQATAAVAIGIHAAAQRLKPDGAMAIFTTSSAKGIQFTQGAIGKSLPFSRVLTWHKTGGGSYAAGPWHWDTVQILVYGRGVFGPARKSSLFTSIAKYARPSGHPAELPPGIADWLYEPFDAPDITVLDPFCGTGALLEPAVRAGRRVIGIEIEERYCEIAARRLDAGRQPDTLDRAIQAGFDALMGDVYERELRAALHEVTRPGESEEVA